MAATSQHISNKVKAYALLPKTRRPVSVKGVETDEDKFAKHLERAAVLLEEQMVGNEEEEGGESEEDDGSDEEDELFHVEVDDVTAGSFGEGGKGLKGFKRFKDLYLIVIGNAAKKNLDKAIKVDGGFQRILLYPWWELTLNLQVPDRKGRKIRLLKEPAQVKLRDDPGVDETILSLFLNECGVHHQHILLLQQIAQRNSKHLLFKTLRSSIECMQQIEDLKDIAYCIQRALETSDQGKLYHCANFTRYCSALFPKVGHNIVRSLRLEKLQEIDDMIKENPWDLGYMVKTKEHFGLTGTEVKLKGFIDSRILYKMPLLMQNALYVYNAMKRITYNDGHTYVTKSQLCRNYWYSTRNAVVSRSLSEKEIEQAINYLTGCDVLEKDHLQSGEEVIVFPHIKQYEVSIAKAVANLMNGSPCLPKTAVHEEDFGGDRDQLTAAEMMTEKPVVVMSGPGGCGKTYVISRLLSRVVIKCPLHDNEAKKQDGEKNKKRDYPGTDSCASKIKREKKGDNSFQVDKTCSEDWLDDYVTQKENLSFEREPWGAEMESSSFMSDDGAPQMQTHDDVRSAGKLLDDECLITAPTGRAAAILGRRGKVKAYTMHQVIYSYVSYCRKRDAIGPDGDKEVWKFAGTRLLICDECSLISVRLFSMLVGILQCRARLEQIVLLGDINQLPSIEPGNLLSDVFQTLSSYSAAIKLSTNHRAESQLIIDNARRISLQRNPVFDQEKGFVSVLNDNEETLSMDISNLLSSREKHLTDIGQKKGDEKSQFIAFRRKDCDLINELCCKHYNQHATRDSKKRRDFQIGDKICATKNRDVHDIAENKSVRITNGEIFFLREDHTVEEGGKKVRTWVIDDLERQIKADFKELRKLKIKHAYARTIHTYQGSESDIIIYVVGKPWYQTCQHVYTAITRGKRQAVVVYDESSLGRAVAEPPRNRNTRLRYHLTNKLHEYGVEKASMFKTGTELHRNTDQSMMTPLDCRKSESLMPDDGDDDDFFSTIDDDILTPDVPKEEMLTSNAPKDEILKPVAPKSDVLTPAVPKDEILTQIVPKDEILTQDVKKYETLAPGVTNDETLARDAPETTPKSPELKMKQEVNDEVFSDDDLFPDMNDDILEKQKVDSDDEVLSSIDEGLLLPDMTNLPSKGVKDVSKGVKHKRDTVNVSSTYGMPKEPNVARNGTILSSIDGSFLFPSETNLRSKTGGAAVNAIRRARQGKDTGTVSSTCGVSKEPNVYSVGAVQSSDVDILLSGIVPESDDEILSSVDENLLSSDKVKPVGESKEKDSLMDNDSDDDFFSCIDEKMLSPEKSKKAVPGGEEVKDRETVKGALFLADVKQKDAPPSDFDSEDEFFSSIDEKILSPEKSKKVAQGAERMRIQETVKEELFLDDVNQRDASSNDFDSDDEFFNSIDEKILSPEKSKKDAPGTEHSNNREAVRGALFLDDFKQRDALSNDFISDDELLSSLDEEILSPERPKKTTKETEEGLKRGNVRAALFLGGNIKPKDKPPKDVDSDDEFLSSIEEKIVSPEKSERDDKETGTVLDGETFSEALSLHESSSDDSGDDLFSDEISETQSQNDNELVSGIVENKSYRSKSVPDQKDVSIYKRDFKRVEGGGKSSENIISDVWGAAGHDGEDSVNKHAPLSKEQDGWLGIRSRSSEEDYFNASVDMETNLKRHSERLETNCIAKETDHCTSFSKGDNRTIDLSLNRGNIPLDNLENDCKYVEMSFDETDSELTEAATQYYRRNDDRGSNGISVLDSKRSAGSSNSKKNRLEAQDCRSPKSGLIIDENGDELLTQDYSTQSTVALVKDNGDSRFLSDDNSDEDFLSDIDEVSTESQELSFCRGSKAKAVSKQIMNSCQIEDNSTCNSSSYKGSASYFDCVDITNSEVRSHSRAHSCSERSNEIGSHGRDDRAENSGTEVRTQTCAKKSRREQFESWSAGFCERIKDEKF